MKKKIGKVISRTIATFLSILFVIQVLPLNTFAEEYRNRITSNDNSNDAITQTISDEQNDVRQAEIICEKTDERDEYTKHFLMNDGTIQAAQYAVPVHYYENNKWNDYDNTLSEIDSDDQTNIIFKNKDLINTKSDVNIRLSKKTNGNKFVRIDKDNCTISWYYVDANKRTAQITKIQDDNDSTTLDNLTSVVRYEGVFKSTDFEYILNSVGVKENIILNSDKAPTAFVAEYKTSGLKPVVIDDKTIDLQNSKGKVIYTITAPYMEDAIGETCQNISISISNIKSNSFTITVNLDSKWLEAEERVFPVTVDPAIQTKQAPSAMTSTFVDSSHPNTAHGIAAADAGSMYVGKGISEFGTAKTYIKANALPNLGGIASKVIDARLTVFKKNVSCLQSSSSTTIPNVYVYAKKVTSSWTSSSLKYNNQPSSNSSVLDYMEFVPDNKTQNSYQDGAIYGEYKTLELTELVKSWYDDPNTNYGIVLDSPITNTHKVWFYSIAFTTYTQTRPVLTVTYRNMSGLEDYLSYTSINSGRNGLTCVNNYTGNLIFTQPLTQGDGGNLMPVNLSLIYNSNKDDTNYANLGIKAQTNYNVYLVQESGDLYNNYYRYYLNDSDGTKHWFYFENGSTTTGKDEDGLGYTLDVITVGSDSLCTSARYRITDKDKNRMYFDTNLRLIQISNSNNVSIMVSYTGNVSQRRISQITDGAGRQYKFNYTSSTSNYVSSIQDPSGRHTTFTYDSNNRISRITFADNKYVSLSYDSNGLLYFISDIDTNRTKISYQDNQYRRVSSFNWGSNDSNILDGYSFVYRQNETEIIDINNRRYIYQFNDYGQNTGIISKTDRQAKYFEYSNSQTTNSVSSRKNNKVTAESKIITSVTNYALNQGFTLDSSTAHLKNYIVDVSSNASVTADSTMGHLDSYAAKITKSSSGTGKAYIKQTFSNKSAGYYTFSGYVNTNGSTITGNGIYFAVQKTNSAGVTTTNTTERIKKTNGWERFSVSVEIAQGDTFTIICGLTGSEAGTFWLDNIQVEYGLVANTYNLLENNTFFDGLTHWSSSATIETINDLNGYTKAITKPGQLEYQWVGLSQNIYSSGKKGDVFSIGGWIKAFSVPLNNLKEGCSRIPRFALALHFYNSAGTCIGTEEVAINPDVRTWQFVAGKVVAPTDYSYICYEVIYYNNLNNVHLTGGFCYKEEFGQTYTYDSNGNVISTVDLAKSQSSFKYKYNLMNNMINPSGSEYIYAYDQNNNNLLDAISTDKVEYNFTYDEKGNPIETTLKPIDIVTSIDTSKSYIIRNKYSLNAIGSKNATNASGTSYLTLANKVCTTNSNDPTWNFELVDSANQIYRLKSNGKYINIQSNTNDAHFELTSNNSGISCQFKVVNNSDGTFSFLTKTSNYSRCIDGQPDNRTDVSNNTDILQFANTENDRGQRWYLVDSSNIDSNKSITTSATYSSSKNYLSSQTDSRGNTTNYSYNELKGTLSSTTNSAGVTTSYNYDATNNALLNVSTAGMTNSYTYSNDKLTNINVNNRTQYKFEYDSFGRTTSTKVGNGTTFNPLSTLTYNNKGLLSTQTYGNEDTINYIYNSLDQISQRNYNGSNLYKVTYVYGANGNISAKNDYLVSKHTRYNYDLADRLVSVREYSSHNLFNSNNLTNSTDYTYADKTNYLTGVTHFSPLGTQTIGYNYGNIANGQMPDTVYSVSWNGSTRIQNTFDSLGRLSSRKIPTRGSNPYSDYTSTDYTYLDVGDNKTTNLISSMSTMGVVHDYTYDSLGNITSIYDGSQTLSYEYDSLNQLVRANNGYENRTHIYEYENGNITYDHVYNYTTGDLPSTPLYSTQYLYNNSVWGDVLTGTREITYNSRSNAPARSPFNSNNSIANEIFGDREYNVVDLSTSIFSNQNSSASPMRSTVGVNSVTDSEDISPITVDAIGNMLTYNGATFSWLGRQLQGISSDFINVEYSYDMDGRRVGKSFINEDYSADYTYYYNGDILAGFDMTLDMGDGPESYRMIFMYDESGEPFGFNCNGEDYYYVRNAQNDIYLIVDSNGYAQVLYQYDAWGKIIGCLDGTDNNLYMVNPYMYRGYYFDMETGFYYLKSRYYNPEFHRFINADSAISDVGGDVLGYNVFAYCMNDPVNLSDEDGNWPKWATKVLIGTAVIAVAAVLTVATAGTGTALACFAVGALKGAITGAAIGAISGAVSGAITHRVKQKTWKGAGQAALDGAADGYMSGAITGFIAGGLTSSVCFVAGTAILTSSGLVNIEQIKVGDKVWSEDPDTGEKGLKTVVRTFENETTELVYVKINGEEIITTPEHPFYVPNYGWTSAIELRAGDILVLQNGNYVVVEKVQHEILEAPIKVYNFEVEDFHTYYVGNSSVLVHNLCKNPGGRHGGQAHRAKIENIKSDLVSKGWEVSAKESRVYVNATKYRYPDIIATKNGVTRFYQVGRQTLSGQPVARELAALRDLSGYADKIFFIPYN